MRFKTLQEAIQFAMSRNINITIRQLWRENDPEDKWKQVEAVLKENSMGGYLWEGTLELNSYYKEEKPGTLEGTIYSGLKEHYGLQIRFFHPEETFIDLYDHDTGFRVKEIKIHRN